MDHLFSPQTQQTLRSVYGDLTPIGLANIYGTHSLIFRWCEYLAYQNGVYSSAVNRLVSYFITKIEMKNIQDEIRNELEHIIEYDLDLYDKLREIGFNFMVYGNCFVSVIPPTTKYIICPKCSTTIKLTEAAKDKKFDYKWKNYTVHGVCPICDHRGPKTLDEKLDNHSAKDIIIKIWNIHEISIKWNPFLNKNSYIWRIPGYVITAVQEGDPLVINTTPKEIIECVKNGKNYKFDDDSILHLRETNLSGIIDRGWGIPKMLTVFPQLYFVQLMHRYNEALALDYVIPTRVVSPAPQAVGTVGEAGEPVPLLSKSLFKSQFEKELEKQKRDPTRIVISPVPIQYQVLGGEAKSLAPVELLTFGIDTLLSSLGLPVEMFKGTMQIQAMPLALRMMENSTSFIPKILNRALRFIINKICSIMNWPTPTVYLEKVTIADDLQRQLAKLQLMMQGVISQTTGLKALGIDLREEFMRMLEDEQFKSEVTRQMQEKMQREGALAGFVSGMQSQALNEALMGAQPGMGMGVPPEAAAGGAAAGGGGGGAGVPPEAAAAGQPFSQASSPQQITLAALLSGQVPAAMIQSMSPQDLEQVAQQVAQELFMKPETIRLSELRKLKQVQPLIHARVVVLLEELRHQTRLMGGELLKQLQGMGM